MAVKQIANTSMHTISYLKVVVQDIVKSWSCSSSSTLFFHVIANWRRSHSCSASCNSTPCASWFGKDFWHCNRSWQHKSNQIWQFHFGLCWFKFVRLNINVECYRRFKYTSKPTSGNNLLNIFLSEEILHVNTMCVVRYHDNYDAVI